MKQTLDQLLPGRSAVIINISNRSRNVKRRLVDMGLTPGTKITVKKIAPFGDPIEVNLRGYELSLRKDDAAQIEINTNRSSPPLKKGGSTSYIYRTLDPETLIRMQKAHIHEMESHPSYYDPGAHDTRVMKIALVGNPNSGKTSLFNALTGSNQYVGNWPGVTVEKKEGIAKIEGRKVTIVDLPGIYSLSPYSMEEIIARDFIIDERPDAIINIVDATNLERNLYLTMQLLELERPMVLALNFMDEIEKRGDEIDVVRLSKELGVPVVPITAKNGTNLSELLLVAHKQMHVGYTIEPDDLYDDYTHQIHHRIDELIHDSAYKAAIPAHWASIKLIEGDELIFKALDLDEKTIAGIERIVKEYERSSELGDRETLLADSRYRFAESVVSSVMIRGAGKSSETISEKIDKIATHKVFAVPAFLAMMLVVFLITFGWFGSTLSDAVGFFIEDYFSVWIGNALMAVNAAPWLINLVTDGVISGVGGVLTFLPQITLLFFFLSLLEDSGYMARAAFIMDRLLRRFGLSGKAFIPMLMGFGCTVPAVMGARTMENEKDRRMTIMLVPFMSCSAKLPVYGLIAAAFFGRYAGLVIFSLYFLGLLVAILSGLIFKNTLFSGEPAAFVMEMPPYRMPSLKNTLRHVWEKVKGFLLRAGTVILTMSVLLWFLQNFNTNFDMVSDNSKSILGAIGGAIAPALRPLGFGTWQAAVALLTGIIAKEAVVASMSMFYGFSVTASGAAVALALGGDFSPLAAFSFLVFILLYIPCIAAIATIRREMNSIKWTLLSVFWQLFTAYTVSMLIYQIGRLLGLA